MTPADTVRSADPAAPGREAEEAGGTLGTRSAEAFVAGFAEGWRAPRDADSFTDFFEPLLAPDVRLVQPQVPTTIGREAFRERFARPIFELIPDLHAIVEEWGETDSGVLISFRLEGTVGGRPVSWACVDRFTLRDGVATERVAYFDPLPLLGQVALAPRSWPRFARIQTASIINRFRGGRS